ncbi:alpha/beta fold hydrolase [Parahaliea aestuarii]|uniref:Alpha/beta fold hydrolase n=1 Tax=Parahaliea aestuarii TaxID=1852021 RepID=A0A5C9A3V9_9GAMM|nr:alpha/beta fold hydrolase [Parahaliea aestuarii]TXS94460.1 alpha/beta fold hydrolase [Parahaliea aestuarii]
MPHFDYQQLQIHFQCYGSGTPLLLIHGLGSRGDDWHLQVPALSRHYRVIAVDLRGHGASEAGPPPLTIPAMAADMVALLDHLQLPSAHVVGFSLGGMVAQQMALIAPSRLLSMCLINSGPFALPGRLRRYGELTLRTAVVRLLGMERLAAVLAARLFPHPEQAGLARRFRRQMGEMPRAAYLAALQALRRWDISARLPDISAPTLIIASDRDYTPVSVKRTYAARMPQAELAVVTNSGHAAPMDQPDAVNRLLLEFIDRQQ